MGVLADTDNIDAGPGPFQQQRPPLFPGGAGPPAQGQPEFHTTQAPDPAAALNMSSEPASQPRPLFPVGQAAAFGAALAQGQVPNASASAQPALQSQLQPVFPIGQGAAIGGLPAPGHVISSDYSAQPALQPHSVFPAGQSAAASTPMAPGLAGGPQLGASLPSTPPSPPLSRLLLPALCVHDLIRSTFCHLQMQGRAPFTS